MKKLIACIALMFGFYLTASAQSSNSKLTADQKKELKASMEAYKTKLKLTPEQQSKFEQINSQFAETLATLKNDNGSKLSKYRKFKTATTERDKKMKDLLTADQYKIFKAHQDDVKHELKSRRGQNSGN